MFKYLASFVIWTLAVLTALTWFFSGLSRDIKTPLEPLGKKTLENALKPAIVRLVDPEVSISCSAFVVDANYAFTAAHCLNHGKRLPKYPLYAYTDDSDDFVSVHAVAYDTEIDIGLVKGDFTLHKTLPYDLENDAVAPEIMQICGYPRGQKKLACNRFMPDHYKMDELVGHGQVHGGMSGGPLLTSSGKAVGVVSAHDDDYTYVIPLQEVTGIFPGLKP